jgi:hypothetical protein
MLVFIRADAQPTSFTCLLALKLSREMERRLGVAFAPRQQPTCGNTTGCAGTLSCLCLLHYPVDEKTTVTLSTPEPNRKKGAAMVSAGHSKGCMIHISEAEATTTNVATLLADVRAGAEAVILKDERHVAALRSAEPHPGRLCSEAIALAEAHASTVTLDRAFGRDLEEIINSRREPLDPPVWD